MQERRPSTIQRPHNPQDKIEERVSIRCKSRVRIKRKLTQTTLTVDRRPHAATVSSASGEPTLAVLALSTQLTASEHDALQKAISADYLEERGFKEGSHGEILNAHGRTVFDVGFARAIRKVLGI